MFWTIFIELCAQHNKKPNAVAKELGFGTSAVTHWKNGTLPRDVSLKKIADYFNVSVDYLLGKTEKPAEDGEPKSTVLSMYSDHEKQLIEAYRSNPDMQGAVDRLLGIENGNNVFLYEAAFSEDNRPDRYITKDKGKWKKINETPDTEDPLV